MKKLLLLMALVVFIGANSFAQEQKANNEQNNEQIKIELAAKQEAEKWTKLLELTEDQKQSIFIVCLTQQHKMAALKKSGQTIPPGPDGEKDVQFQKILNQDQFREYTKIVNKEMPKPPAPPKNTTNKK